MTGDRIEPGRLAHLRKVRGNRNAAGMTYTLERQRAAGTFRGYSSDATPRLAVRGTLDTLATSMGSIAKARCPCCGGSGRKGYELTATGKRRLAALRRKGGAR